MDTWAIRKKQSKLIKKRWKTMTYNLRRVFEILEITKKDDNPQTKKSMK